MSQLSLLDPPPPPPVTPTKKRRRRLAETTLAAGKAQSPRKLNQDDDRCLQEVKLAGTLGRTRRELSVATGIELSTVTWCVQRLLDANQVFEPVVSHDNFGKPIHRMRERSKVLLATLYMPVGRGG